MEYISIYIFVVFFSLKNIYFLNVVVVGLDFEKAFDSLHRETMWKIIKAYGIPVKVRNIFKELYDAI
jgi:hypothetical protein